MKYLLLLILPLLSIAAVHGLNISPDATSVNSACCFSFESYVNGAANDKDSLLLRDESLCEALSHAYVAAPKDTFPIQVGAFKIKSNAERFSARIENLSDIKVKIIIKGGFYKVRV